MKEREKRVVITISVGTSVNRELMKVKEIDTGHISRSGLVEFLCLYPYTLRDVNFAFESFKSIPKEKKRLIMCFSRKDYEKTAKIIKEALDRKKENEFKLKDAIHYIKNRKEEGEDGITGKTIQEI